MNDSIRSRLIKLAHVASLVRQLRTVDEIGDFMQKSAYGYYQTPQQARTAAHVQQLVRNKEERHAKAREEGRWRQARAYMNHERILSYREAIAAAKKGDRTLLEEHLRKEHMGYWDPQSPYYAGGGSPGQQGGGQEASVPAQEPVASTPVAAPPSAPAPPAPPLPGDESSLRYYQGDGQWNFPEGTSQAQMDAAKQMQQNVDEYSSTAAPSTTSPPATPEPSAVQRQQATTAQRTPTSRDPNKLRDTAFLHRDGFQVRPGDMAATEAARVAQAQRSMLQQLEQENKRNSPADPPLKTYQYWAQPNPVTKAYNKANTTTKPGPAAGVGSSMSSPGWAPLGGGPVAPQPINLNKRVNVPGITNKKKMNKPAPLE